jgi:hypothetical protein
MRCADRPDLKTNLPKNVQKRPKRAFWGVFGRFGAFLGRFGAFDVPLESLFFDLNLFHMKNLTCRPAPGFIT